MVRSPVLLVGGEHCRAMATAKLSGLESRHGPSISAHAVRSPITLMFLPSPSRHDRPPSDPFPNPRPNTSQLPSPRSCLLNHTSLFSHPILSTISSTIRLSRTVPVTQPLIQATGRFLLSRWYHWGVGTGDPLPGRWCGTSARCVQARGGDTPKRPCESGRRGSWEGARY